MATDVQKRRARFRLSSWTGAVLVAAILAVGNYILSVVPVRIDTSSGRTYSVSKATRTILDKLDDTLLIRVVYSRNLPPVYKINERYLNDLLSEYKRASKGKIRVELFDPGESPKTRELAIDYGVVPIQLDVVERDRREVAERFMGVAFFYGDRTEAIPFVQDVDNLEYEITVRIKKLVDPTKRVIGFVANGGAATLDNPVFEPLRRPLMELYDVRSIDANEPIPADVRALWWVAPVEISTPAIKNVVDYFRAGGSVGLMIDTYEVNAGQFRAKPLNVGWTPLLSEFGMGVQSGFVVDPRCDRIQIRAIQGVFQMVNVLDYPYFPLVDALDREHPASRGVDAVTMPFVSPLDYKNAKPGLKYVPIAQSSALSYFDPRPIMISPLDERTRPAEAQSGPFHLALLAEGKLDGSDKEGRVVAFGTSRFVRPEFPSRPSNYGFFFNFIDWLAQDDMLLNIRSKGFARRPLRPLSDAARTGCKYALVIFLPLMTLLAGLIVWQRQRSRRARLPAAYGVS